MASMTHKERALHYFERLLKATDPKSELERIQGDLDSLVFSDTKKPLDSTAKRTILEELEKLVKSSPAFESIDESRRYDYVQKGTNASDNSDILDVISAMKKRG
ncbi:hypothetical protein [Shewanella algae]|uniref:hypothetical protein n=1 Tax=Shewanella algae TaxID=38313 RepID=UPI0031F4B832